jgi:hypothetical protein
MHKIIPTVEGVLSLASIVVTFTRLMINPIKATGSTIQLSHPKHGKNAINIPIIEINPKTKLSVFITYI